MLLHATRCWCSFTPCFSPTVSASGAFGSFCASGDGGSGQGFGASLPLALPLAPRAFRGEGGGSCGAVGDGSALALAPLQPRFTTPSERQLQTPLATLRSPVADGQNHSRSVQPQRIVADRLCCRAERDAASLVFAERVAQASGIVGDESLGLDGEWSAWHVYRPVRGGVTENLRVAVFPNDAAAGDDEEPLVVFDYAFFLTRGNPGGAPS